MDSQQQHQQGAEQATLNSVGFVVAKLAEYGQNASNNISDGFTKLSLQNWIRLTVVVGGYMLLRPYIIKLSTKVAVQKMEEQEEKERKEQEEAAKVSPNDLRGLKSKVDDQDADEGADGSGADWGSKARVRQRQLLRKMMEDEERRRQDEEEDADIQEYLVD